MQRIPTPTAILVGLPEELAETCTEALDEAGVRILRVSHVAAAAERIPVTMPQLIVVTTLMAPAELETLIDRSVAVGAEVLKIDPDTSPRVSGRPRPHVPPATRSSKARSAGM